MLGLVLMLLAASPSCPPNEIAVLSCRSKTKELALCAGPTSKPTWLQYRFGPPGKPELVFPKETGQGFSMFRYAKRNLATGTSKTLTFTNDKTTYEVWWQDGKDGGAGVNVMQGEKVTSSFACTALLPDNWEVVEAALERAAQNTRPDPLAGKSQKEVCEDDSLLLLKYSFDELRFTDGFKKSCCVKGALGDDDRCQLDWPSSDVPLCSEVDLWRNTLFARYGYTFKDPKIQKHFDALPWYQPRSDFDNSWLPAVAQKNVARLKAMVAARGCVADAAPPPTADCVKAGVQWSLDLQKGTRGHMDGMQQSEIAVAIQEQCAGGWDQAVAACLASGKAAACLSTLTEAQRRAVWSAVKAISPDVKSE